MLQGAAVKAAVCAVSIVAAPCLAFWAGPAAARTACTPQILSASYDAPTDRYPHGALGDPLEWGALTVQIKGADCAHLGLRAILPRDMVFEDTSPRLVDVDGDALPELVTVESHAEQGARLTIWQLTQEATLSRRASTPFIGTRFRWLAPVGAADFDGDGHVEIAYVDRPHLARILRIWRVDDAGLTEVAALPGLTNHRFGATVIEGGIRTCPGALPVLITADADFARVRETSWGPEGYTSRDAGLWPDTAAQRADLFACGN